MVTILVNGKAVQCKILSITRDSTVRVTVQEMREKYPWERESGLIHTVYGWQCNCQVW